MKDNVSAWTAFWSAFSTLFRGVNEYAQAFEESGKIANESVATYADKVRAQRLAAINED